MSRRSFTLECQRLVVDRGYQPCEPHQACRTVIKEITLVPGKNGRKPYRIQKNLAVFSGAGMMLRAKLELASLTARTSRRPTISFRGAIWGRSLTTEEYLQTKQGRQS